jgi:hypothetical protein
LNVLATSVALHHQEPDASIRLLMAPWALSRKELMHL